VNLSAQDVEGFQLLGCFYHFIYQPVLEAFAILYLGIREVGPSFIAGFAIIILLVPMQSIFSKEFNKARRKTAGFTDERLKLVNQALTGARLMVSFLWFKRLLLYLYNIKITIIALNHYTNIYLF